MTVTSSSMTINAKGVSTSDVSDNEDATSTIAAGSNWNATVGTGSGQVDLVYSASGQIADGVPLDIDLSNLTDAFGAALAFLKVKAIFIRNLSTVNSLNVGNAALEAFEGWISAGGTVKVEKAGSGIAGVFVIQAPTDGYPVVADTSDLLRLTNNADGDTTDVDYEIVIQGTSV